MQMHKIHRKGNPYAITNLSWQNERERFEFEPKRRQLNDDNNDDVPLVDASIEARKATLFANWRKPAGGEGRGRKGYW